MDYNDESLSIGVMAERRLVITFLEQFRFKPIVCRLLESQVIHEDNSMISFFVNLVFHVMNECLCLPSKDFECNDPWTLLFEVFDFVRKNAQHYVASRYYIVFERLLCNPWLKVLLEVNDRLCSNDILNYRLSQHRFIQLLFEQTYVNPNLLSFVERLLNQCFRLLRSQNVSPDVRSTLLLYGHLALSGGYSSVINKSLKMMLQKLDLDPSDSVNVNTAEFERMSQSELFMYAANESKAYLLNKKKMKEIKKTISQ